MNTMLHTCITDKGGKIIMCEKLELADLMTDKELAKLIRSKALDFNVLLEKMARRDIQVSIGTESTIDNEVNEDIRIQRVSVFSFSKTERF